MAAGDFISPSNSAGSWFDIEDCRDENTATFSFDNIAALSWSSNVTLTLPFQVRTNQVRWWFDIDSVDTPYIRAKVNLGTYQTFFEGYVTKGGYQDFYLPYTFSVSQFRMAMFNWHPSEVREQRFHEFFAGESALISVMADHHKRLLRA